MKIIHRGVPPSERIWIGTCLSCGTVAEATESELQEKIEHDQRDGSFAWKKCPVCDAGLCFEPKEVKC